MNVIRVRLPASLETLSLETIDPTPPGPGEVQVRLRAASLNFRDTLVVTGVFPARDGLIPLSDAAGEVVATGSGVGEFKPGDAVVSVFHTAWGDGHIERAQLSSTPGGGVDGYASEIVTRPAGHFTHAPRGYSPVESATLPCAAVTAWRALAVDGMVRPGERVLVQGTGGVSMFSVQIAKAAGATVIAISSSQEKLERLTAAGADYVVNYHDVPKWGEAVLDITAGLGVEHVVEVGGPATLAQSMAAARTGGHIALIGAVGGFSTDIMPFAIVQAKRLRVQGVTVGSRKDQIDMIRAIETNGIRPIVDRTFPLANLADAFRHLQSGRHVGKVCIAI